jgi:uncharacterized protein YndB with AHSA1/START domain
MKPAFESPLDLAINRIIKAPRTAVWQAWSDPLRFARWWVPAPTVCRVSAMELEPGGAFVTEISENGGAFMPHINGCFLAIAAGEQIVFTTCLTSGWRPAEQPFITAIINISDHPLGTEYTAHVMHKSQADRNTHQDLGFYDGWGMVIEQLARLVEPSASV